MSPPLSSSTSSSASSSLKRNRPRGLWKARRKPSDSTPDASLVGTESSQEQDDDTDDWPEASAQSRFPPRKRRRTSSVSDSEDSGSDVEDGFRWNFSQRQTCGLKGRAPPRIDQRAGYTQRERVMDTSSTAFGGTRTETRTSCTYEDWLDLKDLFNKAAESYHSGSPKETLPLLRGVVHECHAFLNLFVDPSSIFATSKTSPHAHDSYPSTPSEESPEWISGRNRKCKCVELPTAFHAILGTALFLMGNLIDMDGSFALPGEPTIPAPFWLAALDVFETGENLPSRVYGTGCDAPEDWRMAIVWGRTLVALADTIIQPDSSKQATLPLTEPKWSSDSPFAAIALRRPPLTRRMSLTGAAPNDLMVLAMDQFSRGIFHMPHPQRLVDPRQFPFAAAQIQFMSDLPESPTCCNSGSISRSPSISPAFDTAGPRSLQATVPDTFSRPNELYTIADEVLQVAEKLSLGSERRFWACWADSVLNQMKMEVDMDAWRATLFRTRGKCWLIAGSAYTDEIESALEEGQKDVLRTPMAEEARNGLEKAIFYLEKGRGVASEEEDRKQLLAESFMTLSYLSLNQESANVLFQRGEELCGYRMDVD
ncbi:hypothetical protein CYLTODRAFT_494535 [Cylindrobasidium torrendii FP15055 ss-10]|uniref:Uncharacterized protein n=1 Tax=Cylindrobasidium torrendii FP15055 ss-10 TaxID=1314674 RepID=A0A0D7AXI4_9AGAR|nr:hypothetical protein CYLTODRAFT_494535 [Cylindrobasidium torrendii FP15055 ss-10]